jgi:putative hemolysin
MHDTRSTAIYVEIPQSSAALAQEVARLGASQILLSSGDTLVAVARAVQIPRLLHEIGRLRELCFRAVGEGTGKRVDLDPFDESYMHLFVWDARAQQVLGAYRIGMTDVILRNQGVSGLYTSTLFDFAPGFFDQLGCALEMGRSFVRLECQRTRVLAYLWRGIGRLLALRPRYRKLFGPVSVSSRYSSRSRQLIAHHLLQGEFRHELHAQVSARHPLLQQQVPELGPLDMKRLHKTVTALEPTGEGVPVLMREYVKLGGQFLAFSVDPDFGDALDGLVAVDLSRTDPRLLSLYMGVDSFKQFAGMRFQRPDRPALQVNGDVA